MNADESFIKEVGIQYWKLNDNFKFKNSKIKLGIISGSLKPTSILNSGSVHCSSISDSFYSTFLNLPKDKFEFIIILLSKIT